MSTPNGIPEMMTTTDVARAIKRTERCVCDLIRCGKLRATRFSDRGRWLVYADSLRKLIGIREYRPRDDSAEMKRLAVAAGAALGYTQSPGDGTL